MSDSEDPIDPIDEGGDDLFGDDDDGDVIESPKERVLDDDDLASDPEGETYNRYRDDDDTRQQDEVTRETMIADVTAYRHPIPKPSDGILRALRVPKFLKFLPEEYHTETFQASEFDIANARSEQQQHVVRFRRDDSTGRLHSNANILRWDDGSVTISVGGEQYEVIKKPLAPAADKAYDEVKDVHYYAAAAELSSNMLITVGHVTEQYTVRPSKEIGDDALNLLADRMAQATKASQNRDMIIRTTVDPELQKKKAELVEKERMKAQRKRENAQAKQETGYGRSGRGGLSIGALEGGRRDGGRKRPLGSGRPRNHGYENDSDEELLRGAGRQEKYEDDGFVVDSDEEEEEEEVSEDDDDLLDDAEEAPRKKRQKAREPEEDEDASGDDIDPIAEATARSRRRNVIDDDDEDEE